MPLPCSSSTPATTTPTGCTGLSTRLLPYGHFPTVRRPRSARSNDATASAASSTNISTSHDMCIGFRAPKRSSSGCRTRPRTAPSSRPACGRRRARAPAVPRPPPKCRLLCTSGPRTHRTFTGRPEDVATYGRRLRMAEPRGDRVPTVRRTLACMTNPADRREIPDAYRTPIEPWSMPGRLPKGRPLIRPPHSAPTHRR